LLLLLLLILVVVGCMESRAAKSPFAKSQTFTDSSTTAASAAAASSTKRLDMMLKYQQQAHRNGALGDQSHGGCGISNSMLRFFKKIFRYIQIHTISNQSIHVHAYKNSLYGHTEKIHL